MPSESDFGVLAVHHVQMAIPADGETKAKAFWCDLLGMTEVSKPSGLPVGGCWLRAGSVELHLGFEEDFAPARKAHPGLLVTDARSLADRLEAAGFPVTWAAPVEGFSRFHSDDPFGNRIEFLERHA